MLTITSAIERQYQNLYRAAVGLIREIPAELLYRKQSAVRPHPQSVSFGECLVRSAATAEQTFGGITTNLWDDPFEWTLPEAMPLPRDVENYLDEVDAARARAFSTIRDDSDLSREIGVPAGGTSLLAVVLVDSLTRAYHQQGIAFQIYRSLVPGS